MKNTVRNRFSKYAIRVALLGALSTSVGLVSAQAPTTAKPAEPMAHSMMSGMDTMKQMKSTGDVDKDFAMMMKAHHEGALEMAKIELASGKSPKLKRWPKASSPVKLRESRISTSGLQTTRSKLAILASG